MIVRPVSFLDTYEFPKCVIFVVNLLRKNVFHNKFTTNSQQIHNKLTTNVFHNKFITNSQQIHKKLQEHLRTPRVKVHLRNLPGGPQLAAPSGLA